MSLLKVWIPSALILCMRIGAKSIVNSSSTTSTTTSRNDVDVTISNVSHGTADVSGTTAPNVVTSAPRPNNSTTSANGADDNGIAVKSTLSAPAVTITTSIATSTQVATNGSNGTPAYLNGTTTVTTFTATVTTAGVKATARTTQTIRSINTSVAIVTTAGIKATTGTTQMTSSTNARTTTTTTMTTDGVKATSATTYTTSTTYGITTTTMTMEGIQASPRTAGTTSSIHASTTTTVATISTSTSSDMNITLTTRSFMSTRSIAGTSSSLAAAISTSTTMTTSTSIVNSMSTTITSTTTGTANGRGNWTGTRTGTGTTTRTRTSTVTSISTGATTARVTGSIIPSNISTTTVTVITRTAIINVTHGSVTRVSTSMNISTDIISDTTGSSTTSSSFYFTGIRSTTSTTNFGTLRINIPNSLATSTTTTSFTTTYNHSNLSVVSTTVPNMRDCKDDALDCVAWAAAGECDQNPSFMNQNCASSCKVCTGIEAVNVSRTRPKNANHREPNNSGAANQTTQAEVITATATQHNNGTSSLLFPCIDMSTYCQAWARSGQCSANPVFMMQNCNMSCNACRITATTSTSTTTLSITTTTRITSGTLPPSPTQLPPPPPLLPWAPTSTTTTLTPLKPDSGDIAAAAMAATAAVGVEYFEEPAPPASGLLGSIFADGGPSAKPCGIDGPCHDLALVITVAFDLPTPQRIPVRLDSRAHAFDDQCLGMWLHEEQRREYASDPEPALTVGRSTWLHDVRAVGGRTARYGSQHFTGACLQDSITVAGVRLEKQYMFLVQYGAEDRSNTNAHWAGGLSLLSAAPLNLTILIPPTKAAWYLLLAGKDAYRYLKAVVNMHWVTWDASGWLPAELTGHYESKSWRIRIEVDLTTTFMLVSGTQFPSLIGLLLPPSLQYLCSWYVTIGLVYCHCSVQGVLAPLHISMAGVTVVLHALDLLKPAADGTNCVLRIHATDADMPSDVLVLGAQLFSRYSIAWDVQHQRVGFFTTVQRPKYDNFSTRFDLANSSQTLAQKYLA
eukprot:gnl/MRDRNA2_/MRDRNA2_123070_c0_seq1.p1 gnl/MRDRNA2_/MRDRNA2_123070_c0~~gnl/MRDRNA2_/MRDRNA2_123070_c0_seq1.p1  ORF type:complete len:1022 (+),score=115.88 gnl/MRDRNA2_/MRDRNA2_123070_c0_seq1:181-3246(+)